MHIGGVGPGWNRTLRGRPLRTDQYLKRSVVKRGLLTNRSATLPQIVVMHVA